MRVLDGAWALPLVPLLGMLGRAALPCRYKRWALWLPLGSLALATVGWGGALWALWALPGAKGGHTLRVLAQGPYPGAVTLSFSLRLDILSAGLGLAIAVLGFLTQGYMLWRHTDRAFGAWLTIAIALSMASVLAGDLLSLVALWVVLSVASYATLAISSGRLRQALVLGSVSDAALSLAALELAALCHTLDLAELGVCAAGGLLYSSPAALRISAELVVAALARLAHALALVKSRPDGLFGDVPACLCAVVLLPGVVSTLLRMRSVLERAPGVSVVLCGVGLALLAAVWLRGRLRGRLGEIRTPAPQSAGATAKGPRRKLAHWASAELNAWRSLFQTLGRMGGAALPAELVAAMSLCILLLWFLLVR